MPRIKLTIAYVGTGFAGWQIQPFNQGVTPRTVQGELEKALEDLLGQQVRVHSSGRTDSGVHADRQVAHFDAPAGSGRINWQQALHRRLPEDISILSADPAAEDFHARFDCTGKIYTYGLWLERRYVPPKLRPFVWACGSLDIARMEKAARFLLGKHDFAGFQNTGSLRSDTVRTLSGIEHFYPACPGEANAVKDYPYQAWRFHGDGFLKQMVRNLMGFLVYVGQDKLEPEAAFEIFAKRDRTAVDFPTAPAWGLTLTDVLY